MSTFSVVLNHNSDFNGVNNQYLEFIHNSSAIRMRMITIVIFEFKGYDTEIEFSELPWLGSEEDPVHAISDDVLLAGFENQYDNSLARLYHESELKSYFNNILSKMIREYGSIHAVMVQFFPEIIKHWEMTENDVYENLSREFLHEVIFDEFLNDSTAQTKIDIIVE